MRKSKNYTTRHVKRTGEIFRKSVWHVGDTGLNLTNKNVDFRDIQKIEQQLQELHQLFKDLYTLVEQQVTHHCAVYFVREMASSLFISYRAS